MRWRGRRPGTSVTSPGDAQAVPAPDRRPAPQPPVEAPVAVDPRIAWLRPGMAAHEIEEHQVDLGWLRDDIERLAVATTAAGSLIEELAADLGREFDRMHEESASWAQGPAGR